jgi:hypothetical protein
MLIELPEWSRMTDDLMAQRNRLGIECARRCAASQPCLPNPLRLMASTKPLFLEAKKRLATGNPPRAYRGAPSDRAEGGASARLVGLGQSGLSLEPIDGAGGC